MEFKNDLLAAVLEELHVTFKLTVPYMPQSNGIVERTNRVVKDALISLCAREPHNWDEVLPQVRFALNTSIHRSVMDQPIHLFLGHQVDFPIGLTERPIYDETEPSVLRERLQFAWDAAQEASSKARAVWTRDYNKRVRKNVAFKESYLVLTKVYKRANALSPRWSGPARIIKKIGPVVYLVKALYGAEKERKVHVNYLKPYFQTSELQLPHHAVDAEDADPDDPLQIPFHVALLAACVTEV